LGGISKPGLASLEKKGIASFKDLLELPPLRYQDRRELAPLAYAKEGESIFFSAVVTSVSERRAKSGLNYLRCTVEDLSGLGAKGALMFFRGINYILRLIRQGDSVAVLGTPNFQQDWSSGRPGPALPTFAHPEFWNLTETPLERLLGVFPVYGRTGKLTPGLRKAVMARILESFGGEPKILPEAFLAGQGLKDPTELVRILHAPPAAPGGRIPRSARDTKTFKSLALMELVFWRTLALREKERRLRLECRRPPAGAADLGDAFVSMLPFSLSGEQARVLAEIKSVMERPSPANVLLQGEVGSGKTAVAAALLFRAAGEGRQGALVAPTDLLARQHFEFLLPYAQRLGVGAELFAGSNPASKRKKSLEALASGEIRLAVGTQALLFPKLAFRDLALAVVDEQHRFGVKQRLALREKNAAVDLVSMSATPIPRSLALTFYGEMDISSIRGTLPGRRQPEVEIFYSEQADAAYSRFAELLRSGEKGFLVSPKIGEAADEDGEGEGEGDPGGGGGDASAGPGGRPGAAAPGRRSASISEMQRRLEALAPDVASGVVHGRLDAILRSKVMSDFREGAIRCLVATTIVEVGVDIPGVNVMLIEGAETLGLAQLHQLRGRLGRGGGAALLILLAHGNPSDNAERRFQALKSGADGYYLAELDLKLRGPGDDLGLKQSGWPDFAFAKFPRDLKHLPKAFELADALFGLRGQFPPGLSDALDKVETEMAAEALGI
jgi:ATP-dependent DNA helicase RecG